MNRKEITDASENINTEQDGNTAVAKGGSVQLPLGPWLVPMFVVLALITGVAVAMAVRATDASEKSERETRMLEYYLLEMDAKLIAHGIKSSDESISKRLSEQGKATPPPR